MKWRRELTDRRGVVSLILWVCIFLLGGCSEETKVPGEVPRTAAEKRKAEMLKAIDRDFEDVDAHFVLGRLYQADGLWAKAENQYRLALNFDPSHRRAQAARVKVLEASGDKTKSEQLAKGYIERVSLSAVGSLQLAMAFKEQGLDGYALKCYMQALRIAPKSAKVNKQIGYYYLSKGNRNVAREYLSRSFQLNPNQPEVAGELGRLGVPVRIPRKTVKNTKKPDKIVEKSEGESK